MDVEFDAVKNTENERKHGISLSRAEDFDLTSPSPGSMTAKIMGKFASVPLVFWMRSCMSWSSPYVANESAPSAFALRTDRSASYMPKGPEYGTPDEENPEWTREDMAKAMRYPNLPPELMRIIEADKKKRGTQIAPKKQAISIRLSPDVLDALRATGPGWQARVDEALRAQFLPMKVRAGKRATSSPAPSTGSRYLERSAGALRASNQR